MARKGAIPQAKIGDIVLVSTCGAQDWVPAMVLSASDPESDSSNITLCNSPLMLEGCKHVNDPWWDRDDAQQLAHDEDVGVWKQTEQQIRIDRLLSVQSELLALAGSKQTK